MKKRALVRYYRNGATILCPRGSLLERIEFGGHFAGSMSEAELGAHASGKANRFDRAAPRCDCYCCSREVAS